MADELPQKKKKYVKVTHGTRKEWEPLMYTEATKPKLPKMQKKWKTRVLAETVAWKIIAMELEIAANNPHALLTSHGYIDDETPEEAVAEFKEVLLDVAEWFKSGKRLPFK